MQKTNRSYASPSGQAYFKHTGRYNEVTKDAIGNFKNDAPAASKQKNLAPKKGKSAASTTLKSAVKELGW